MKKLLIAALAGSAAMAAAAPAMAQQGAQQTMTANSNAALLNFAVSDEARAKPDQATIGAGVQVTAPTAVEAMRQNAVKMDALIKAVKARGIKDEDIQTRGINLSAQYDYSDRVDGQPPRFIGYQVSNSVRVTTSKIADVGAMLDALVAAGGTDIDGPSFSIKDPQAAVAAIRGRVIAAAKVKAEDYARLAGYRTAELVAISEEGFSGPRPEVMLQMAPMAADARMKSTPVEPGQVSSSLTLNFSYRLVR